MSFSVLSQKLCRKGAPALARECTTAHARYYKSIGTGKARITMRWMILPSTSALHGLQGTLTRATQNTMISAKFCCALKHQCQELADQFHATSSASLFHLMEHLPDSNTSSVPEEPSRRLIQNPGRFLSFNHTMWNARTRGTKSLPQSVEFK